MRRVIAAAPALDAGIVLLRRPRRHRLPPNVHVVGWVPLDRALRHATAFVHHGGSGGLLQALAAGVPHLATPGGLSVFDTGHTSSVIWTDDGKPFGRFGAGNERRGCVVGRSRLRGTPALDGTCGWR